MIVRWMTMTIHERMSPTGLLLMATVGALVLMTSTAFAQDRSRARSNSKKTESTERVRAAKQERRSARSGQRSAASRRGQRVRGTERSAKQRAAKQRAGRRGVQRGQRTPAQRRTAPSASRRTAVSARGRTQRVRRSPDRHHQAKPPVTIRRSGKRRAHRPPKHYRPKHRRSNIHYPGYRTGGISIDIDIAWPWPKRHRRAWKPRYRYRQIVNVNATWARRRHKARIDVRTQYHHRVLRAGPRRAEVVIVIDAIELYAGGRYLGVVDRIPSHLRRVKATIYRDGHTQFDRDLFVVGTPRLGFELIATRSYDRPLLGAYHRGDWLKAGRLDFYAGEVVPVRRSRLFRPHAFNGLAPISLLPERAGWRFDVGVEAISAYPHRYQDDHDGYGYDDWDDERYFGPSSDGGNRPPLRGVDPLRRSYDDTVRLPDGGQVTMAREVRLERVR